MFIQNLLSCNKTYDNYYYFYSHLFWIIYRFKLYVSLLICRIVVKRHHNNTLLLSFIHGDCDWSIKFNTEIINVRILIGQFLHNTTAVKTKYDQFTYTVKVLYSLQHNDMKNKTIYWVINKQLDRFLINIVNECIKYHN